MKSVLQVGKDVKTRRAMVKELLSIPMEARDIDARIELIQAIIPLGLLHVQDVLQEEVRALAGERYRRNGVVGYDRWGSQWGSVYIGSQKVPTPVPRVRDKRAGREVKLKTYGGLQEPRKIDEGIFRKILHGLSCRRYEECSEAIPEAFGLSPSTVSRRFIRASKRRLKELCERRLEKYDLVALVLDGKSFAQDEMVLALGITIEGKKVILGFVQTATENARVLREFLEDLIGRGLRIESGLLCILDGSKGIRKAVEEVFGAKALVQRCQWHKRENVVSYLPKTRQDAIRRGLQRAYEEPSYEGAKKALEKVKKEISLINESAVRSLEEGLEETLTLHRLGLFEELGKSLKTTNCMESLMAQIGQKLDKVDYWKNSNQKQRWLASALLDIEPRLNRVKGYRYLPELRLALQRETQKRNVPVLEVEEEVAA
jgi:transposase-like protein